MKAIRPGLQGRSKKGDIFKVKPKEFSNSGCRGLRVKNNKNLKEVRFRDINLRL